MNGVDNRKKTKKRKIKRAGSSMNIPGGGTKRKRLASAANGDTEAEVQRRLEENLQRHAEAFLTINLYNSNQIPNLQPVKDPDPLFTSELMECRDSFLSRSRERHLEFSTLRRAKFSTLAFLYEIHTENKDTIIYVCNGCQTETETPRLCKQCPNYYLCEDCFKTRGHDHPMTKVLVSDDSANAAAVQQSDRLRMERCVELLKHTSTCRDANCRISSCRDIKRRLVHMQTPHDRSKCLGCRQMNRIIVAHSVKCNDANCQVMFCAQYKAMKKQQESQQRLRKLQTLRRRQKTMQCANNIRTPQQPNTPQQQTGTVVNTPGGTSTSVAAPHAAATTTSPTVLSGPGSTETPHSFNSQVSIASPHATSAPRNSPPKPTSVPMYPSTLQYSHTSPYQNPPHQSPLAAPKAALSNQTQHLTSAVELQQTTTVASPFVQQPVLYHQQQQSQQLQMHPPQMQQSKSYPSDVGFVRQSSNPQGNLYENGQRGFINSPMVAMSPRMHFQPSMNPEAEDVYSMQSGPMKRQYFNEGDMVPTGPSGTMYPMPGGGPQPPRQPRMMMPTQPQVANMQNSVSDSLQQQQTMMHWSSGSGVCAPNGQVMPPNPISASGNKMSQMPPSSMRPQQHTITNQPTTPPTHLVNPVGQPPNAAEVDMVISARRGFFNEIEVSFSSLILFMQCKRIAFNEAYCCILIHCVVASAAAPYSSLELRTKSAERNGPLKALPVSSFAINASTIPTATTAGDARGSWLYVACPTTATAAANDATRPGSDVKSLVYATTARLTRILVCASAVLRSSGQTSLSSAATATSPDAVTTSTAAAAAADGEQLISSDCLLLPLSFASYGWPVWK